MGAVGPVPHRGADTCFPCRGVPPSSEESPGRKNLSARAMPSLAKKDEHEEGGERRQGDITLTQGLGRQSHSEIAGNKMGSP